MIGHQLLQQNTIGITYELLTSQNGPSEAMEHCLWFNSLLSITFLCTFQSQKKKI